MHVSTYELRRAAEVLLRHMEESGQSSIRLDDDYYWSVPTDSRFDVYGEPPELGIGRLFEDIEHVRAIVSGKEEPLGYGLVWLSAIFLAAGERAVG